MTKELAQNLIGETIQSSVTTVLGMTAGVAAEWAVIGGISALTLSPVCAPIALVGEVVLGITVARKAKKELNESINELKLNMANIKDHK